MTPEQFCYWLQGRAELMPDVPLNADEWQAVKDHLQLVFKKETPVRSSAFDALAIANERIKRERLQQQPLSGIGSGLPQCGTIQDTQFGRNHTSIC